MTDLYARALARLDATNLLDAEPALKLLRALLVERMPRTDVDGQVEANSATDAALREFAEGM